MTATERWLEVATVGRTHGVRGEAYVRLYNPESALLRDGARFRVRAPGQTERGNNDELVVRVARRAAKGWLVSFEGIGHRDAAAALTNSKLFVQRSELPELDDNEVYLDDLIGFSANDQHGRPLGRVMGFFDNGAHDVCVIRSDAGAEVLLPFRPDNLIETRIDLRCVVLDVPDGIPGLAQTAPAPGPDERGSS